MKTLIIIINISFLVVLFGIFSLLSEMVVKEPLQCVYNIQKSEMVELKKEISVGSTEPQEDSVDIGSIPTDVIPVIAF